VKKYGDRKFSFYQICAKFGWYFDEALFDGLDLGGNNVVGVYIPKININRGKTKSFEDNIMDAFLQMQEDKNDKKKDESKPSSSESKSSLTSSVGASNRMLLKWGTGFEVHEYTSLENLYKDMVKSNPRIEDSPQEKDYLRKICLTSLLLDKALMAGDEKRVSTLSTSYSNLMKDSKLRAMDKSEIDKTGGLRNFAQWFADTESEDYIPPWEKHKLIKGANQDIVDKSIMHIENHTRRFRNEQTMVVPPDDTPKIETDEIDPHAEAYLDRFIDEDDDND